MLQPYARFLSITSRCVVAKYSTTPQARQKGITSRCVVAKYSTTPQARQKVNQHEELPTADEYEIVPLSPKYFESSWKLVKDVFFSEEKACQFLKLDKNVEAQDELKGLFSWITNDGLSLAIRDTKDDTVTAAILNKRWSPRDHQFLQSYHKKCKNQLAQKYVQEIIDVDIFKMCNANNIVELFMAASRENIRGKRLTSQLYWRSLDMAKKLSADPHDEEAPKAFLAIASTPIAQYYVGKTKGVIKWDITREMEHDGQSTNIDYMVACLPLD